MTRDRHMFAAPSSNPTVGDHSHRGVDPERLQLLGKQASARYADCGGSLTDAVADVLRDEEGLSQEHVKRVVENANNYAFEALFQKQAGDHRVINFDGGPADPGEVLRELGAAGEPVREKIAARRAVVRRSERFVPGIEGLEDAFTGMSKTASAVPDYPHVNPHRELFDLKEKVAAAKDHLLSRVPSLNVEFEESFDRLYKEARQVVLDGHSPATVSRVLVAVSPHPNFTKLALRKISERFDSDMPAIVEKTKTAGLINTNHPLCTSFHDFTKVAAAYFTTISAIEDLANEQKAVDAKVREVLQ